MTVLERYLGAEAAGQRAFDELAAPDGTVRAGWSVLLDALAALGPADLVRAQREVARLLADDLVTYTPSPASTVSIADPPDPAPPALNEPRPWRLDPLPLIVDHREWSTLEAGVVQRAELLDAVLADLYGARRLLAQQALPAAAVLDHDEYLRSLVGAGVPAAQRLFLTAADLGRDATGAWKVISDRTQAPSGAGFAMQNRRVVSRVLPEVHAAAHLHRLTPFFSAMRLALVDAAPPAVEDPRVVVLSPGTHSETAFDQAALASLLGFPLLEGRDLTVRDGRVWLRSLGRLEPVDVILRRVDSTWMDALELRPGSRLGVTGLLECVRRGTVSVVNPVGSGVLENPALLPFLPELCRRLLGEPLRLPSVETWWCGEPASLSHVLAYLDRVVVRPIGRGHGRSVLGGALTAAQRERLVARLRATPHRFVGQEVLDLSSVPTSSDASLVRRNLVLRTFAVRSGASYAAMLGGLARVTDDRLGRRPPLVTDPDGGLAKDVWVVGREPVAAGRTVGSRGRVVDGTGVVTAGSPASAMVPRVLSDLFWFGRYAERAEDLVRLVLATQRVAVETRADVAPGRPLPVLLEAVTHVSTAYPGFGARGVPLLPELRSMLLDRSRAGTVAQSVAALTTAAQGVRDQLSEDVWMVLAGIDRALAALAADPPDQGLRLTVAGEQVLSGLLALTGISGENMVRDPGWHLLDAGRGLERALQVVALLRATLTRPAPPETERLVVEAVLTAAEPIVTFRRRDRGRAGVAAVVELLVTDPDNPRSVAHQLRRMGLDLGAMPATSPNARPLRLLDGLTGLVRTADPAALAEVTDGRRGNLGALLSSLAEQLRSLSEAIGDQYHRLAPDPQPIARGWR